MGKRTATPASQRASKAKAAKVDPVAELCRAVQNFLASGGTSVEAASVAIVPMLPHVLVVPAAERHDYHNQVLQELERLAEEVIAGRRAVLAAAEADAGEVPPQRAAADERLREAAEVRSTKERAREELEKTWLEASDRATEASETLEEAQRRRASLQEEVECATVQKDGLEKMLAESLARLREGSFTGAQWRLRNTLIDQVSKELAGVGAVESLIGALAVVFKAKPDERGAFGIQCIDAAEELVRAKISACGALLTAQAEEAAARDAAVASASEVQCAARLACDRALQASKNSSEELEAAVASVAACEAEVKAIASKEEETTAIVAFRQESVEQAEETRSGIRIGVAKLTEAPAEPAVEITAASPTQVAPVSAIGASPDRAAADLAAEEPAAAEPTVKSVEMSMPLEVEVDGLTASIAGA